MKMMNEHYSDEEKAAIAMAVEAANEKLAATWQGRDHPRYFVSYVELGSKKYDEDLDDMITDPVHFLAADSGLG